MSGVIDTYAASRPELPDNFSFGLVIMLGLLLSGEVMQVIVSPNNTKSKRKSKQKRAFDAQAFLDSAGLARKIVQYRRRQRIYAQGDPATSVMYIQNGGVKLSIVNEVGKEAVVAISDSKSH